MRTTPKNTCLAIACGLLLCLGITSAQADYAAKVLSNSPVVYWRLNDKVSVPAADKAVNLGNLGAQADGFYQGTASHPATGALAAGSDTAASFDATAGTAVSVPYFAAMVPPSAFTIEAWLNPGAENAAGTLTCALSHGHLADPRSGWIIYQSDTGWNFRMYNKNGTATSANITGGSAPVAGTWYHVVAVYDGTNASVYVNGAPAASATTTGYVPNTDGPFVIGGRSDASYYWNGSADEVAYYGKTLTAAEISTHYSNGKSATPATPYNQLVLTGSPLAYFRLNEPPYMPPSTLPVAKNQGSQGAIMDGSINPGIDIQAAGPRPPILTGFEADNTAAGLNGIAGFVGTPFYLNDMAKFSVMGWIKRGTVHSGRGGYFGQNDLLEFGDADSGANIEAWINAYNTNIKIPYAFRDNEWGLIALVGDGSQVTLYTNGVAARSITNTVETYGISSYPFNIGGGGIFNATGDNFLGSIDEVAVFDKALTGAQVQDIYLSANIAPTITQQPEAPTRVLFEGNTVTLSVAAAGSPTLLYQWRKAGADLAGKTSADLVFSSITVADAGNYDVVVRNDYGSVTSAVVTLSIRPADSVPPALQYATGSKTFNGVRIWFSEPLDTVTAQTAANYAISGGLTVTSAKLSAPAGSTGDNIVDLVTSAQIPGQTYTVTVTGVKDQGSPGNAVAAGSTVSFTAWTLSQGFLTFEHYDNLSGAADSDITTALQDPRVVAGTPTTLGYLTGSFDTRSFFADDTHENYLGRISGFITPTESGDYHFFLSADDAARLYLSTNETMPNPAVDTPICAEPDCCDAFYEPDSLDPATTANPIPLQAGKRYAVLALLKEAGGGDYLRVAWRKSTDTTPATSLPYLPGQYLAAYADPNADLQWLKQPTDQAGVLPSAGIEIFARDFSAGDGGFSVTNTPTPPPGPWVYDATAGKWAADGGESACSGPYNSGLNSPPYKLTQDGSLSLTFSHRYSFESGLWDAGQVRISVNDGPFTLVPAENFSENGYAPGNIIGTGIALGQRAFNGDSPGYAAGQFITSKALLGTFSKDDILVVQFIGAWDECTTASVPGWAIASMKLDMLPMIIQDFSQSNGGYTVENTTPAPPGPWAYVATNGAWVANGGESACSGPYNSKLNSPAYVVTQSDEVTLSFTHRYSFESGLWDGGQVRISVNGADFASVSPDSFTANGYAAAPMEGTGILKGQRAFNGDSPGYATNGFITSSVILGTFNKNDIIVVQFVGAWDECSTQSTPGWAIKHVQLAFGKAARAVTFEGEATASRQGQPVSFVYQWQRNDGAGFVDIVGANAASLRFYPNAADFAASFRLAAIVPGKVITSSVAKITQGAVTPPDISIKASGAVVTITYTGTLQASPSVASGYQNVNGATSPYSITNAPGIRFFRSVK